MKCHEIPRKWYLGFVVAMFVFVLLLSRQQCPPEPFEVKDNEHDVLVVNQPANRLLPQKQIPDGLPVNQSANRLPPEKQIPDGLPVNQPENRLQPEKQTPDDLPVNQPANRLQPEKQTPDDLPGVVHSVVHYIWCGNKKFRFKDYLSVLSALKVFQPLKLVFHFTHQPQVDDYNVWFMELKSSVAGFEMQELSPKPACGSVDMLKTALGFLSADGGIFVGENVIMSRAPRNLPGNTGLWFTFSNDASDQTRGVVVAKSGFNESVKTASVEKIKSMGTTQGCSSVEAYNGSDKGRYCVIVTDIMYPRDIIEAQTPFAELTRWLFYGRPERPVANQDSDNRIPRISHYVRLKGNKDASYRDEFSFNHFLSVLSALYVGGFEHVYVHADEEPRGRWWEELAKENVTVVKAIRPSSVFQTRVNVLQHVSDVERYLILYKYGGAYQDFDVVWTSHVPDSLLSYPLVVGMEWVQNDKEWPESFNLGVILAMRNAPWLHHYIDTHKEFRDKDWGFNSLRMSYRTYEKYPQLMHLDRKLQVLCCYGVCHPAWEKSYVRPMSDSRPTIPFRWQDVRSVHVTCPKPHPSLAAPKNVKEGKDMYAEIGRFILEKSGRQNLLS